MNKILIVTHSTLAEGLYNSIKLLIGDVKNVSYIDAYIDDSDWTKQLDEFFKDFNKLNTYIVFTDLYGGSVNQQLVQYQKQFNFILITGTNLPVLLATALAPKQLSKQAMSSIVQEAQTALKIVEPEKIINDSDESFLD